MKGKYSFLAVAAAAILFTGCSSEEPVNGGTATDGVNVRFAVALPAANETRDISDGLSATQLYCAIYKKVDATNYKFLSVKNFGVVFSNRVAEVDIVLVNNVDYRIAFFAQNPLATQYSIDTATGKLNLDYSKAPAANSDLYDCFYTTAEVSCVAGLAQQNISLYRPLAQVNVGSEDWVEAKEAGFEVEKTGMTFSAQAYQTMDLFDGSVSNAVSAPLTYTLAALPDPTTDGNGDFLPGTLTLKDNSTYYWMGMNYILVGTSEVTPTLTFSYEGPQGTSVDLPIAAVPVQRNYRTNIVGRFFTTKTSYRIVIEEGFENDKETVKY